MPATPVATLTAILPCNDVDTSEQFYRRLGFTRAAGAHDDGYRILERAEGGALHLTKAVEDWLTPGRNPFGLYLYTDDVDGLARSLGDLIIDKDGPSEKPWGMYEFAVSDPDATLVRIGRPARARA